MAPKKVAKKTSAQKVNIEKVVFAGILTMVAVVLLGWLTSGWLFSWIYDLAPNELWLRGESDTNAFLFWMYLGGLALMVLFALIYAVLYKAIPGKGLTKGLWFGFFIWLVATLPEAFFYVIAVKVSTAYVIYAICLGLVENLLRGLIVAWIYK